MPKTQIIYSNLGVYSGPAPSTGFHFISPESGMNNDYLSTGNYPLVFPIRRVTSTSYSFEAKRTPVSNLGDFGSIANPVLNDTEVKLNITYNLAGLLNEMRLGLLANVHWNSSVDEYLLYGTGRVPFLSGLYTRDMSPSNDTDFGYPLRCREPRNIFVAAKKDSTDLNDFTSGTNFDTLYKNTTVDVYGFGDCFLAYYGTSAAVNQIPEVSVSFLSNNVNVYSSGLGCDIPSINTRNYDLNSGIKFSIPNTFDGTGLPTVMLPKDITLSIRQTSNNSENLSNLLFDFRDVKIQSYKFDVTLNRRPLYSMGYKYPLDKVISPSIIGNLSFEALPGDSAAGSIASLIKNDEDYDISIKLNYQPGSSFNGCGVCYEFLGAKFNGFNSSTSIQQRTSIGLSFTTELDPKRTDRGLFVSGYLGVPNTALDSTYLGDEFDFGGVDQLLFEDGDSFVISMSGYKLLY